MRSDSSARPRTFRAHGGEENLYIVAYDISDPRRWRRVFRLMNGYGEWLQLSVFQCRLSRRRRVELKFALGEIIDHVRSGALAAKRRRDFPGFAPGPH
jgi:CRISPR/Cas system-associated endoribonuclease Cas2